MPMFYDEVELITATLMFIWIYMYDLYLCSVCLTCVFVCVSVCVLECFWCVYECMYVIYLRNLFNFCIIIFCFTWKTVTKAQSNVSKFFRSHSVSSSTALLSQNLHPNSVIPRILFTWKKIFMIWLLLLSVLLFSAFYSCNARFLSLFICAHKWLWSILYCVKMFASISNGWKKTCKKFLWHRKTILNARNERNEFIW